ncbi:MAG: 4-(cytidine 5'-diphospho)-2-C-methyl-D-erythritol kinase [Rhodoferax sp.]|nr:4-(cytidine 5'-diphospho)-2-C-methyl-D-erythritol kinase [Rhodoferax sp.]
MQSIYDVCAPAKLNLFLHIIGRRADGLHLLQSAFMLIDWCDTLHFHVRNDGQISREDLSLALPPDDLVLRAARALQRTSQCPLGVHIGIQKNIPAQAGMGGGSSDAASTLLALNRLWNLNLALPELARIGLALGADVPFFLSGGHAWVEGIGEQITPMELPQAQNARDARFVVVKPDAGLETKRIFSDPALKRNTKPVILRRFVAHALGNVTALATYGRNDLQVVAQRLCPDVAQALAWLRSLGLAPRMTGSGSAVFAQLPPEMQEVDVPVAPEAMQVRVCGSLAVHPLAGWAGNDGFSVGGS